MQKKLSLLLSILLFGLIPLLTFAQQNRTNPMKTIQAGQEEKTQARCERITARIDIMISRYENNKSRHQKTHDDIKKAIQDIIDRLKNKGYEVSKLEKDLQELETLVEKFSSDYEALVNELKNTKNYACGQSEGEFAKSLKSTREQLRLVRNDILTIRQNYQTTIRPDIQAIKQQTPANS